MKTIKFALASVAALGLAYGTALAQGSDFSASNPKLDGNELTVDVNSPQAGWAVIHTVTDDGKPGDHIGYAEIKQGENDAVQFDLDKAVTGKKLIVMLHEDAGKKGTFEFGPESKADMPVTKDGKPVMETISVQ